MWFLWGAFLKQQLGVWFFLNNSWAQFVCFFFLKKQEYSTGHMACKEPKKPTVTWLIRILKKNNNKTLKNSTTPPKKNRKQHHGLAKDKPQTNQQTNTSKRHPLLRSARFAGESESQVTERAQDSPKVGSQWNQAGVFGDFGQEFFFFFFQAAFNFQRDWLIFWVFWIFVWASTFF